MAALVVLATGIEASGALLPPAVRTSSSPPVAPIQAMLTQAVTQLTSANPVDQGKARDAIVEEVGPVGAKDSPSPAFFFAYAHELNSAIKPALASSDMHCRLNAAIAICRVAEKADVSANQLLEATNALLNDQSDAVVLWGLKAARPVSQSVAAPPAAQLPALLNSIGAAGLKVPSATWAAYWAMTQPAADAKSMGLLIDAAQKLLDARVGLWSDKVAPEPTAETIVCSMLAEKNIWKAHSAAQKAKTLDSLKKLTDVAATQVTANVTADQKDSIALLVYQVSSSFGAIAVNDGKLDLANKITPIIRPLRTSHPTPDQIVAANKQVDALLLAAYPTISGGSPTTAPTAGK